MDVVDDEIEGAENGMAFVHAGDSDRADSGSGAGVLGGLGGLLGGDDDDRTVPELHSPHTLLAYPLAR